MGKLTSEPETSIHHFSHPHPLQLSHLQPQQKLNLALCSCCKLKASGWFYSCTPCNYFLHISCSKMPQQITHPIDQNHALSLLPNPIYPQGFFSCDACGEQGNGFSYHCGTCNIDLHPVCSTMPLSLTHQSHHHHLNLTFSPPYPNKSFSCDICKNMGCREWLYRCNMCEFDAHLVCATTNATAPIHQQAQNQMQHCQAPPPPSVTTCYQVPGTGYSQAPILQIGVPCSNTNYLSNVNYSAGFVGKSSGQQNGLSEQQAFQLLLNATVPGLGFLMKGLSGGGAGGGGSGSGGFLNDCGVDSSGAGDGALSSFNGDFSGMDFGAMGGMDLGGFGGF